MSTPRVSFPPLQTWMRNLLLTLFLLYVAELIIDPVIFDLGSLWLHPIGMGFAPWQPVTRFFVQGRSAATNVLISLVVLYFFLPVLQHLLKRRQWIEVLVSAVVAATVLPMLSDLTGMLPPSARTGWLFLIPALIVVFGLAMPRATVNLMFVLPVPASFFVWGTLFFSIFYLLVTPTGAQLEPIGAWLGVMGWWFLRGPGSTLRSQRKRGEKIEKNLPKLRILDGGLSTGNREDDYIH